MLVLFEKTVKNIDGSYDESEWVKKILSCPPTKEFYASQLKTVVGDYLNSLTYGVKMKNYVYVQAGLIKHLIPCKDKCPDVDVSKIVADYYSMHDNLPVPEKVKLMYVNFKTDNTRIDLNTTIYLLKALPDYEVYWERKYYRSVKLIKKVSIVFKKMSIVETLKNREFLNLVYYDMFDINTSTINDVVELIKVTNPDGVYYFELNLYNNLVDYDNPARNTVRSFSRKIYFFDLPEALAGKPTHKTYNPVNSKF